MTKDEIKKGLKCCETDWCVRCPYFECIGCEVGLKQDALNLIAEQEKEIERLKAENEQSRKSGILGYNATVVFLDDAVSEHSVDCKDIEKYAKQFRSRIISINEKEIKQAKIDILNKVKEHLFFGVSLNFLRLYVDELIEEIENEQKD